MAAPLPVKDEIRNWLTELLDEINEHGKLSLVVLNHCSATGGEIEIFPLKSTHPRWGDANNMAEMIFAVAARHARGLPGQQQFVLHGMFGEATSTPARLLPFGLPGALTFGAVPGGLSTEPPTLTGQAQQTMRHIELLIQGAFAKDKHATDTLMAITRDLTTRLGDSQNECRELMLALKECFATLMELQKRAQLDIIAAKQRAVLIQEFTRLMPAALNGVTGRNIFPVAAGDTALLRTMLRHLDDDKMKMLAGLAESQGPEAQQGWALLVNRFDQLRKEDELQDKKIEEMAGEHTGMDYAAAAGDAAGRVIKVLRRDDKGGGSNGSNGSNGHGGGGLGANGAAPTKQLVEGEKKLEPTDEKKPEPAVVDTTAEPVIDNAADFGRAFIDAAKESDIAGLAGIMRMQGKHDLADKMEAAFKAKSKPAEEG